jgi:hypothetical protein
MLTSTGQVEHIGLVVPNLPTSDSQLTYFNNEDRAHATIEGFHCRSAETANWGRGAYSRDVRCPDLPLRLSAPSGLDSL